MTDTNTPLSDSDIAELKRLCADATPGPWRAVHDKRGLDLVCDGVASLLMVSHIGSDSHATFCEVEDAAFIAASRTALPALIEFYEKASKPAEEVGDLVRRLRDFLYREIPAVVFHYTPEGKVKPLLQEAADALSRLAHENAEARALVAKQAEDERLWFQPLHITEDTLQRALRALHAVVEGVSPDDAARAFLARQPSSGDQPMTDPKNTTPPGSQDGPGTRYPYGAHITWDEAGNRIVTPLDINGKPVPPSVGQAWSVEPVAWRVDFQGGGRTYYDDKPTIFPAASLTPLYASPPGGEPPRKATGEMVEASLTERRAEFVYEGARIAAIAANAPIIPEPWAEREEDFRSQFREVIDRQCGPNRCMSPAELHADWVEAYRKNGWRFGPVRDREARTHPDMVPYEELGQLERDKDAVFVALCEIARLYIYDLSVSAHRHAPDQEGERR